MVFDIPIIYGISLVPKGDHKANISVFCQVFLALFNQKFSWQRKIESGDIVVIKNQRLTGARQITKCNRIRKVFEVSG